MIGKKGQWCAEINGNEVNGEELIFCVIHEQVGLGLPVLQLHFRTQDEDKARKYNSPNHIISVGMGRDSVETTAEFKTFSKKIAPTEGSDQWSVRVDAFLNNTDYLLQQRCRTFNTTSDTKRASEVWSEVMSGVGLKPDTSPSNDRMLWLQTNNTDRQFLEEVTWHSYWGADDPALSAIRRDKTAVFKPYSQLKQVMGVIGQDKSSNILVNDFNLTQNEGFMSAWAGSNRRVPFHHFEKGIDDDNEGSVSARISSGSGLADSSSRVGEIDFLNDNVHDNWHVAYRQNRQFRASMSGTQIRCTCYEYHDVNLLQTWEARVKSQGNGRLLTPFNGDWLVTELVTSIEKSAIMQHISMNREVLI